jgi:hypothetical protein
MRLRRPSTVVFFLLLGASAYAWIPDPASGRALIVVDSQRAIYNAAAIGLGSASLGNLFIGLFGFYFLSNALRRDVATRCGLVLAATPVRNAEYLLGKLVSNILFLTTFMAGFAITSLAMLAVRGEAPFAPLAFVAQYLLMVPPSIVMVATLAIVFESVPLLAGRLGDVLYFFIWMASLALFAVALGSGGPSVLRYFDISGFGLMIQTMQTALHSPNIAIGASDFDPALPTLVFEGLPLTLDAIVPRLVATVLPLILLPLGLLTFHRFDPARVRGDQAGRGAGRWKRLAGWARPLARPFGVLRAGGRGSSLFGAARQDAYLTLSTQPFSALMVIGVAVASAATTIEGLRSGVLPVLFVCLAVSLADIACREARHGTRSLVYAAPGLERGFVLWKLLTALLVSSLFVTLPLVRLLLVAPRVAASLLVGTLLVCAAATCLGVLSHNPKTFIVIFLSFWYLAVNGDASLPALDFAGFHATATAGVTAGYLVLAALFALTALLVHRARLREDARS